MRLLDFVLKRIYRGRYFPVDISYFREAITQYSKINARGKVIIDVGADWGTTPLVWAAQGAKKVIAYEANRTNRERMRSLLGREPWLEIRGAWDGSAYPSADIFKADCEGCEYDFDMAKLTETYPEVLVVWHKFDPDSRRFREVKTQYRHREG